MKFRDICIFLSIAACLPSFPIHSILVAPTVENTESKPNEDMAVFTPPSGWYLADAKSIQLPPKVKVMVIGKGSYALPPSMNLSMEPFNGTLKQYLQIVKRMNDERGYSWKDLGAIKTQAGTAGLSQVDTKSQWGDNRQMHAILLKNGMIYILTASAMKDEFSLFYQDFFKAMKSLRIATDFYGMMPNAKQKDELKNAIQKVKIQWKELITEMQVRIEPDSSDDLKENVFMGDSFQTLVWKPFILLIKQKYADLGMEWQKLVEKKVKEDLFALSDQKPHDSTKIKFKETK
jgi:hypothetical protein